MSRRRHILLALLVPLVWHPGTQAQQSDAQFKPFGPASNAGFSFAPPSTPSPAVNIPGITTPPRPATSVAPPTRFGAPLSGSIPVQRWKTPEMVEEIIGTTPTLEWDTRLTYAMFDSPDQFFFDNLQFLSRLRGSIDTPGLGALRFDAIDRWNIAVDLLSRDVPDHIPELQRLFWEWSAVDFPLTGTFGRQRLSTGGNRTIGSVSWLPDLQVFDGARLDAGDAKSTGKWTLGAFIDSAMTTPFYAGDSPDQESPMFLAGAGFDTGRLGKFDTYLLGNIDTPEETLLGIHWQEAKSSDSCPVVHMVDFLIRPGMEPESGSLPWHLAVHRQHQAWTWHAGAEHIDAEGENWRQSATPGTFRYLPGGPDTDSLNVFLGFDCRLDTSSLASLTFQQLWDEESGASAANVLEAAVRRQISPTIALIGGGGLGLESLSGDVFLRSGVQLTAAF